MPKSNKDIINEIGAIPKSELVHCAQYLGVCRNACVAKWDAKNQKFYYLRTKFEHTFMEKINHPEDDDGFDLFIPYEKIPSRLDDNWKYPIESASKFFPKK